MLCQLCNKRIANVHLTQVVNSNKVEMYLCEQCAKEKGSFGIGSPFNLNNFFTGLIGYGDDDSYIAQKPKTQECNKCGMSYDEFQKTGKLGCNNCYELFGDRLKPLVKRLHGNTEHSGKVPEKISKNVAVSREITKLKEQLGKAVQNEEYEKAAELRDKIKNLEVG